MTKKLKLKTNNMKKSILTLLLLVSFIVSALPQSKKLKKKERFKSELISTKNKIDPNSDVWEDWSNWDFYKASIVYNRKSGEFIVSDKGVRHIYFIIYEVPEVTDEEGDVMKKYVCLRDDNTPCFIKLVTLNTYNGEKRIYVERPDSKVVYHIK